MRQLFIIGSVILVFVASEVFAQMSDIHQKSTTPPNARYEIVQSELAAKWAFRLDRYTGQVSQLVRTSGDGHTWEEMIVQELPEIASLNKPRFLIFTSGLAARHTFLMDTATGKTWVLTEVEVQLEKEKTMKLNIWKPFEN